MPGFEKVLSSLNRRPNLDSYVTGSNSRFLSSEFRGRGDEVRVFSLSFAEYISAYDGTVSEAWADYVTYSGLPLILTRGLMNRNPGILQTFSRRST